MALFSTPEAHAANPPESWTVRRVIAGVWIIGTPDGGTIGSQYGTRWEALKDTRGGFYFDLWHKESRWYAGGTIAGWKSWAECKAEQERTAAKIAARTAARALEGAL